jgi:hypothetical protein
LPFCLTPRICCSKRQVIHRLEEVFHISARNPRCIYILWRDVWCSLLRTFVKHCLPKFLLARSSKALKFWGENWCVSFPQS